MVGPVCRAHRTLTQYSKGLKLSRLFIRLPPLSQSVSQPSTGGNFLGVLKYPKHGSHLDTAGWNTHRLGSHLKGNDLPYSFTQPISICLRTLTPLSSPTFVPRPPHFSRWVPDALMTIWYIWIYVCGAVTHLNSQSSNFRTTSRPTKASGKRGMTVDNLPPWGSSSRIRTPDNLSGWYS